MTNEQIERYLDILQEKNQKLEWISASLDDVGSAIRNQHTDDDGGDYMYGIAQALFRLTEHQNQVKVKVEK